MSDYIKREDAIRQIVKTSAQNELDIPAIGTVIYILSEMDSADVVEVVRCDQCRHFDAINNDDHGWCKLISDLPIGVSVRYHDDYCSYGERSDT